MRIIKTKWNKLKYWQKGLIMGAIIGGFSPGLLHPLKITVFISTADFVLHIIGVIAGALIGLIIGKVKGR